MTNRRTFSIEARGPYAIEASSEFLCGFTPSAGGAGRLEDGRLALGFLDEESWEPVTVALSQRGSVIEGEVEGGDVDVDVVRRQIARVLSLDHDATELARVGERDPVVGALLEATPGFRPVCFPSPYEAAVWAVLAQRTPMALAARTKQKLAVATGTLARGFGQTFHPCPSPRTLLEREEGEALPGISEEKRARLRAIAVAALEGKLRATELRSAARSEAEAALRAIRGVGPWSAEHILIRGCGTRDELPSAEPRVLRAIAEAYGLDEEPSAHEAAVITERWRPFRTWVTVLLVKHLRATPRWSGRTPPACTLS